MSKITSYLDVHNATVMRGDTIVFKGLTLKLHLGEHTCIMGPNGSGKTTLLKLLTRELYPVVEKDSHLRLFGSERAILWELRRHIGFVSQDFQSQYEAHVKAQDVVLSGLYGSVGIHGHQQVSEEDRQVAANALAHFGLTDLAQRCYWHLSTGQQRLLLLARAMIHQPKVLVLDEPTNGLDIKSAYRLLQELRQLSQRGTTLLLVTHHIEEVIPEIQRLILLKNGALVKDGTIESVLTSHNMSELFETPLSVLAAQGHYRLLPA